MELDRVGGVPVFLRPTPAERDEAYRRCAVVVELYAGGFPLTRVDSDGPDRMDVRAINQNETVYHGRAQKPTVLTMFNALGHQRRFDRDCTERIRDALGSLGVQY